MVVIGQASLTRVRSLFGLQPFPIDFLQWSRFSTRHVQRGTDRSVIATIVFSLFQRIERFLACPKALYRRQNHQANFTEYA